MAIQSMFDSGMTEEEKKNGQTTPLTNYLSGGSAIGSTGGQTNVNKSAMSTAGNSGSYTNLIDLTLNALRGKLTFEDNYYCEVKTNTHTHAVELEIAIAGNYSGLIVIGTPEEVSNDYIITGWKARRITNQKLGVTILFNGGATISGKVKYIILRA